VELQQQQLLLLLPQRRRLRLSGLQRQAAGPLDSVSHRQYHVRQQLQHLHQRPSLCRRRLIQPGEVRRITVA